MLNGMGASLVDLCVYSRLLDVHLENVLVAWDTIKCASNVCVHRFNHCHNIKLFHDQFTECCIWASEVQFLILIHQAN